MERDIWQLHSMQAAPLEVKVMITKDRIREWVNEYGEENVYVSFSGGKDQTVLLTIARELYPNIKAVFVDTGLEYPEIRDFVKTWDNVEWIKPKMNFKEVIETYGYPFISKHISKRLSEYRNSILKGRDITKTCAYREFNGQSYYINKKDMKPRESLFNKQKWKFMIDAPFKFSHKCCDIMKKNSFKTLGDKYPITAQMAYESLNREEAWKKHGCNAFDARDPISNPMAFWTEQDVLQYIKINKISIASIYGEVIEYKDDKSDYVLKTTGCKRTGCMFCGFGCHREKPGEGRFELMKKTHPKQYEWIMKPLEDGGLGYKDLINWLNEHGNLNIPI